MWHRWPSHLRGMIRGSFSLVLSASLIPLASGQEAPIHHSVAGRVITRDGRPTRNIRVILSREEGEEVGRKTLGYDGSFVFESLTPGEYLLVIERPDFATVGRPIEIKSYSKPRTLVLDIRLQGDQAASIREVVKAYGALPSDRKAEEKSKGVGRRAGRDFLKASAEASRGNRLQAIEHLKRAVEAQPDFFEAHYNLGVHYQALERWEDAIGAYRQAIALRDDTARPNYNLGVIYHNQGKLGEAIARYKRALDFDPSFAEAHQSLGEAYFQKNRHYAAEQHLESATRLAPARAKPSFGLLVKIQLLNNDPMQAQYYLDQLVRHHPDSPVAAGLQKEIDAMLAGSRRR